VLALIPGDIHKIAAVEIELSDSEKVLPRFHKTASA